MTEGQFVGSDFFYILSSLGPLKTQRKQPETCVPQKDTRLTRSAWQLLRSGGVAEECVLTRRAARLCLVKLRALFVALICLTVLGLCLSVTASESEEGVLTRRAAGCRDDGR
jgi:hypothetical protein